MEYKKMIKFLNDNGIMVMQPVIASEVTSLLEDNVSDEEFEDICSAVFENYLSANDEPIIYELVVEELTLRGLSFF